MQVDIEAWNRFVMESEPGDYSPGDILRAAAIANRFMALANNGGPLHYLEVDHQFSGDEVVSSLKAVGAKRAAAELEGLLAALGQPLPRASEDERREVISALRTDEIELQHPYSQEADEELARVLEAHVELHAFHYRSMR